MKAVNSGVQVSIMGKEFVVACPNGERDALFAAAKYLDAKMREVQDGGRVLGVDRCAVMAALNITNELLEAKTGASPDVTKRLTALHEKVDKFLRESLNA